MKRLFEISVILLGTLGWWGFVYPELSLLETSYEETYEEGAEETELPFDWKKQVADATGTEGFPEGYGIVVDMPHNGTAGNKIRIKSKIAEYVYQVRNTGTEKEIQDD